tara:strand:+ start:167 stop:349 length:183 start_codon:yes stop_codon:yes gene_type:complete
MFEFSFTISTSSIILVSDVPPVPSNIAGCTSGGFAKEFKQIPISLNSGFSTGSSFCKLNG